MLRELKLLQGNDLGAVIQQNGAGTRGPLIKSKNVFHVSGRSRSPGARTGGGFRILSLESLTKKAVPA